MSEDGAGSPSQAEATPGARVRLVLASASPARLSTLRRAGLDPEVVVSGVDESRARSRSPSSLAAELAALKADAVVARVGTRATVAARCLVLGCDSVLELAGHTHGKPGEATVAVRRWRAMRGRTGVLHTGHCLVEVGSGRRLVRAAGTAVHFAMLTDAEIDAYVATGEPLHVAGAFTLDGLGGAFVRSIDGDPHNVVGVSLPLLRSMAAELGVGWTELWRDSARRGGP